MEDSEKKWLEEKAGWEGNAYKSYVAYCDKHGVRPVDKFAFLTRVMLIKGKEES